MRAEHRCSCREIAPNENSRALLAINWSGTYGGIDNAASEVLNEETFVIANVTRGTQFGFAWKLNVVSFALTARPSRSTYLKSRMALVSIVNFGSEMLHSGRGQFTLFVQQVEAAGYFSFDQV